MSYQDALKGSWDALAGKERFSVPLLGDTYDVDVASRSILSASCNVPAKDFVAILILHYCAGTLKAPFIPKGEWISFKDIPGGEIYYPAFAESAVKPLIRKFGAEPAQFLEAATRIGGVPAGTGDACAEISVFPGITVRVALWRGDEEFGPEASMLFDRNITKIFTMEDVAVLGRFVAHSL